MPEKKKFLFVVTTGMNEPKKAFTPFYYASASAAMGLDTTIFLAAEGPSLLKREVAENLRTNEGGEPLQKVIDMAMKNGVKFVCCTTAAKVIWKMSDSDLPPGVEFGGAVTLIEMASDPEASVLYF